MTTSATPAVNLSDLPDEMLHKIILDLHGDFRSRFLQVETAQGRRYLGESSLVWDVASTSLVNHRLRRISLPILFKRIEFMFSLRGKVDIEPEASSLSRALKCNKHLLSLIRHVIIYYESARPNRELHLNGSFRRITGKDPETSFIIDILSFCTCLERLELPDNIDFCGGDHRTIIASLNKHPSNKIRLVYAPIYQKAIKKVQQEVLDDFRSLSLSRVACNLWDDASCSDQDIKVWIAQGLNIEEIWRSSSQEHWMENTYPGLTRVHCWNDRNHMRFDDGFLMRHPSLRRMSFTGCTTGPWTATFATKMYPYSYKITPLTPLTREPRSYTVTKIDGEWFYENFKVIFQDDIPCGDTDTVEAMIRTLGKALVQSRRIVGVDFAAPVGEFLSSDELLGIIVRNLNTAETLDLGTLISRILDRENSQIVQPTPIPGFELFCERLKRNMPQLKDVLAIDRWGFPIRSL
ncbi:hypothetical protein K435DRAFT_968260 [Dendrothele bispora CBS 962.96]|uniref:Uncharacterized protein n=1 Tax=Dendrothele bispora (strain CBS 962.96) TaxID=1314807 RepID=A0A4S8LPI3_DENBC|nr:hypothetical protein K435DRAFT_968260 [Dendrothele bispora CBS 962.96]